MKKTDQGVAKGEKQRCACGDPGPERCTSDVIDDGDDIGDDGDDGCGVGDDGEDVGDDACGDPGPESSTSDVLFRLNDVVV